MASVIALAGLPLLQSSWVQLVAVVTYGLCAGIVNPNATILAMREVSGSSAMAAALVGSGKMFASSAAAAMLAFGFADSLATLSWILLVCSLFAAGSLSIRRPS